MFTNLIGSPASEYASVELGGFTPPDGLEYLDLKPSFDAQHVANSITTSTADGISFPQLADLAADPGGGASIGVVKDATSISEYFEQALARSPLLNSTSVTELYDQAYYLLASQKNPKYRFDEMSLQPVDDANLWVQAIGREISDRVTIKRHPANKTTGGGGNLIRKDAFVEQITWMMMGLPEEWTVTYQLSPAGNPDDYPNDKTTPTWAIIGDPVYGVFDAGNVFVY